MKIREVLKKKGPAVHTIDAAEPTASAIARFSRSKVRCLVVTEAGDAVGMLTIRDTLLHLDRAGAQALKAPVREAMTKGVVSITPDSSTEHAHEVFAEKGINHLPVLENGALVGLITRVDLLSSEVRGVEDLNAYMLEYIAESHF